MREDRRVDRCEGGIEGWTDVRGDRGVDRCEGG